jgi:hypothetical protein
MASGGCHHHVAEARHDQLVDRSEPATGDGLLAGLHHRPLPQLGLPAGATSAAAPARV